LAIRESERRIRAVIDTSTLIDGEMRRELHTRAALGQFVAIWSPWIVGELHRVLTWRWLKRTGDFGDANWKTCGQASKTMMVLLLSVFETIAPPPPYPGAWPTLADPWDTPIWGAAVAAGAHYVVSENTRDFPPADEEGRHMWDGIEYVPGKSFLELVDDTHSG
jgi:PIN domain-containing protein